MRDVWKRWLALTLFVVAVAVLFVNLGQWQLDRLEQRRESNQTVVSHESAPVRPWTDVFDGRTIGDADQWQRVEVRGTFLADRQLQARYRVQGDEKGWEAITPLVATDGRTVLVDRGFVRRPAAEDFPRTVPAPPSGEVTVVGYVRRNEQGSDTSVTPTPENTVKLVNSEAIGAWLGRPLVDGFIAAVSVTPAQSPELQPIVPPPLTEKNHFSYALQWFTFALIALVGLGALLRNDVRDRRRARERRAAASGPGSTTAAAGAAPREEEVRGPRPE